MAAARPGRGCGCPLHGCTPDAHHGAARGRAGKGNQNHDRRQGRALPGGQGEPAVPGAAAEPAANALRFGELRLSDFTYVATWQGFVYAAFVGDVFARRIVGWRVGRTAHAGFVLDALEQALHDRRPAKGGLTHHSGRGSQYVGIRCAERLLEAGIEPSVGSAGDSYDNALAETVIGLFKTEAIRRRGPWRSMEAVELAALEWVAWLNHQRLLEPIGNVPPAEAEARHHAQAGAPALAA